MLLMVLLSSVAGMEVARLPPIHTTLEEEETDCPKYKCASKNMDMGGACVYHHNDTYYLSPCQEWIDEWWCPPIDTKGNSTCTNYFGIGNHDISWPNEPCTYDQNCVGALKCTNLVCVGLPQKEKCETHDECGPGLACMEKQCWQQVPVNMTGCTSDYDCVNNAGCNGGTCIEYFSLPPGDTVHQCENSRNFLCQSSSCTENRCVGNLYSNYDIPKKCSTRVDCASEDGAFFGSCECGYNAEGAKYCGLFPQDPLSLSYLNKMKEWTRSTSILKCNTARRNSYECMSVHWTIKEREAYYFYMLSTLQYSTIQDNEDCAFRIYSREYRDALQVHTHNDNAKQLMTSFLSLLAALIIAS